jgi:Holliday junction resolvase-like predicted endonuclease
MTLASPARRLLARLRPARDGLGRTLRSAAINAGASGERIAQKYLNKRGYRTVARNLRTPAGEADLLCIAPDRRTIVVVEVKARRLAGAVAGDATWGGTGRASRVPEAGLTRAKRRRLVAVATQIVRRRGWSDRPVRIDLVAVALPAGGSRGRVKLRDATVRHYEAAVSASE